MMSVIVDVSDCAFPLLYFLLYRLPAHSKCLRITSRPCGLMARKTSDDSHQVSERALEPGSGLGFCRGAGDGNRTPHYQLGKLLAHSGRLAPLMAMTRIYNILITLLCILG